MPTPNPKESESHYFHRAIPQLMGEGHPQAQSAAIAYSMWRRRRSARRRQKSITWHESKQAVPVQRPNWQFAKNMGQAVSPAMSSIDQTTGGSLRPPYHFGDLKPFHRRKLRKKAVGLERNEPAIVPAKGKRYEVADALCKVGKELANHTDPAPMPGYGQILINDDDTGGKEARVWYVGGDGDEDGFAKVVEKKIRDAFPGVSEVIYEAETFPPKKEPGWRQVYPKREEKSLDPMECVGERCQKTLGPGWSYKFAGVDRHGYGLDLAIQGPPQFDEDALSITFPFAASHGRDRVGDFLKVEGIDTTNHRRNPVAFIDHGKHWPYPIGKCESPAGEYTVTIDKERGLAICTVFLDRDESTENGKMARQLFSLFKQGLIRAGSIGYRPLGTPKKLPADPKTGTPAGLLLDRVELLEATACGLPANGDAVRRALGSGWEGGREWMPAVKSMLESLIMD